MKAVNIFIPESIPSSNKGEVAIFAGMKQALEQCFGNVQIHVVSRDPTADRVEYGVDVVLIADGVITAHKTIGKLAQSLWLLCRQFFFILLYLMFGKKILYICRAPIWRSLMEADVILFGHDNLLVGRFPLNLALVPTLAGVLRIPCVIYAGTVGPYSGWGTHWMTRRLLNRVDMITLREKRSKVNVEELKLKSSIPVHVVADAAFIMPSAPRERVKHILRELNVPPDREVVGVTITYEMARRYAKSRGISEDRGIQEYFQTRAELLDALIEKYSVFVVAFSHCVEAGYRDDRAANKCLHDHIAKKQSAIIMPNAYLATEIKGVIGACSLLIGERTHSMIAAVSQGVAIVGISSVITGSKTRGILGEEMGVQEWLVDVETANDKDIASIVEQAWEKRKEIGDRLRRRQVEVAERSRRPAELMAVRFPNLVEKAGIAQAGENKG